MTTLRGFADQLRNSLDIVEVISSYLPLKKRGKEYECLCPFHQEKTPSFKVSPSKQIFHCFGCHKGGDVIRFVQEFEHLDFRSAVVLLAERNGIPVPRFSGGVASSDEEKHRLALFELHEAAAKFFAERLARTPEAIEYLAGRGVGRDLIEAFQLGYAPAGFEEFVAFARRSGYSDALLRQAGLAKQAESGKVYDAFRARVIFPICDVVGRVVAFGGRALDGETKPKYLNSPETPIYTKGRFLYAYHIAKNAIKERGWAIITEGYMDAIACHNYGFVNAVASLGTAFTDAMARLLRRLCSRVVFLYDGDEAGQKAMFAGTQVLLAHDFQVRIVALPPEDDPDSLLRREGAGALENLIERAPDHFDYFAAAAAERFDRATLEGRIAIAEFMGELLGKVRHPLARHDYVHRLSEFLAVPESVIAKVLFRRSVAPREAIAQAAAANLAGMERPDRHETGLLRLLLEDETARRLVPNAIRSDWLFHPTVRSWFEKIVAAGSDRLALPAVLELAENEDEAAFLRAVLFAEAEPIEDPETQFLELVAYLGSRYYDERTRKLQGAIEEAQKRGDEGEVLRLIAEKARLSREKCRWGKAKYGGWSELSLSEAVGAADEDVASLRR